MAKAQSFHGSIVFTFCLLALETLTPSHAGECQGPGTSRCTHCLTYEHELIVTTPSCVRRRSAGFFLTFGAKTGLFRHAHHPTWLPDLGIQHDQDLHVLHPRRGNTPRPRPGVPGTEPITKHDKVRINHLITSVCVSLEIAFEISRFSSTVAEIPYIANPFLVPLMTGCPTTFLLIILSNGTEMLDILS